MLYTCFQRLFKSPSSYALFSHHSRLQVFWCSADYQSQVHHSSRPQSPLMSQRGRRTKRQWRCALEQQLVKARGPSLLNAGGHLWTDSSGVSASNLPPAQTIKFTLSSSTWPLGSTACHSLRKERKGQPSSLLFWATWTPEWTVWNNSFPTCSLVFHVSSMSPCLPVPWGCRFLVQQPGTRPPLTAGLCRGHMGQKAQHAVPALRQVMKQMLQAWHRKESSGRCHWIHLPTSEPFQSSALF